jgi:hypothetical protein
MGFAKPDLDQAQLIIQRVLVEIASPYNDGFTASYCKRDLYMLKCWLDDVYSKLPTFHKEEQWEQDRLIQLLKR